MSGNVWQWCDDWFDVYHSPHLPPGVGQYKVVRGASYDQLFGSGKTWNRSSVPPLTNDRAIGFRTVATE
jgi:formylglycine-generating enzyme required for sulfatase activity